MWCTHIAFCLWKLFTHKSFLILPRALFCKLFVLVILWSHQICVAFGLKSQQTFFSQKQHFDVSDLAEWAASWLLASHESCGCLLCNSGKFLQLRLASASTFETWDVAQQNTFCQHCLPVGLSLPLGGSLMLGSDAPRRKGTLPARNSSSLKGMRFCSSSSSSSRRL